MKKILFILETLFGGGAERVTSELASEIGKNHKYEVHVLTFNRTEHDYVLPEYVIRHFPEKSVTNKIEQLMYLVTIIRGQRPDVIVSLAMPKTNVLLSLSTLFTKSRVILSERNDPKSLPRNKLLRFLRLCTYYYADGVVFQTEEARAFFPSKVQKKSVIICNPIKIDLPEVYSGVREKSIVNYCRFEPQKNLPMLIKAFAQVSNEYPEYTLMLYGKGTQKEELEKLIKNLGLENRVILNDFSVNIHDIVKKASLFVSSSNYEGISNSMLESMALGLPVICTDCPAGGARMVIKDGINGLLVPVGDDLILAEKIRVLLSDETLRKQIGEKASEIRNIYSLDAISSKWIEYIED